MNSSSKYLEQFNRVKRSYERFASIDQGRLHECPSNFYKDDVDAFFQNCYHLKDWIINDENVETTRNEVETFITNNIDLRTCADICNKIKHLKLNREPRSGFDPQFEQTKYKLGVGGHPTTISVKYTIDTLNGLIDAFELATRCLEAWRKFIKLHISNETNF